MSFGQPENLPQVKTLETPDFTKNKLHAADPLAFIQFNAELDAQLLAIDGQSKYLPPGWTVNETTPGPISQPVEFAARQTRNNKYNYVNPPASQALLDALEGRINTRMLYDISPPVQNAVAPPNYATSDVTYLGILQEKVQIQVKLVEKETADMGSLILWIRERCSPDLLVNLDFLHHSDQAPISYSKNMIYRLYCIYLEGVCKGDNVAFRGLILHHLAMVGQATTFLQALVVIDQLNYWYKILLAFDRTHPTDEPVPTVRSLVNMLLFRFPDEVPMTRLRKPLVTMLDTADHRFDWSATMAVLRLEIGRAHPTPSSRSSTASAGSYSTASFSRQSDYAKDEEIAHLQNQLQNAYVHLAPTTQQASSGVAPGPPVSAPQPVPGHQYPFNAGNPSWGLVPPRPTMSMGLCRNFPWCTWNPCHFKHLTDGEADPQMDVIQEKAYAEQLRLPYPLARGAYFKDRASPALLEEYNRLVATRAESPAKRQRL